jgi:hypothetical protein
MELHPGSQPSSNLLPCEPEILLSKLSFREGNISPTLFTAIVGTLVTRVCSIFCMFNTHLSHMMIWELCNKVAMNAVINRFTALLTVHNLENPFGS